jgi:hypothetical protein
MLRARKSSRSQRILSGPGVIVVDSKRTYLPTAKKLLGHFVSVIGKGLRKVSGHRGRKGARSNAVSWALRSRLAEVSLEKCLKSPLLSHRGLLFHRSQEMKTLCAGANDAGIFRSKECLCVVPSPRWYWKEDGNMLHTAAGIEGTSAPLSGPTGHSSLAFLFCSRMSLSALLLSSLRHKLV